MPTSPDFFIVGAPKCGTTALSEYLRNHRNILMSWPKEPHYFAKDFDRYRRLRTRDEYMRLFSGRTGDHLVAGEASVWYLYSSAAAQGIHEFNPQARIIVMLRNPVDMLHSLHSQLLFTFREDEPDFEKSWRLQACRKDGHRLPAKCLEPSHLQWREVARFPAQLRRVFQSFDKDQVKIIIMEDLVSSAREVYEDVLEFLGVPSDGRKEFPRINVNTVHRRPGLGRFFYHPPRLLRWMEPRVRRLMSSLGIREFRAWHRVLSFSSVTAKRPPLPATFRAELVEVFREDVHELSSLLNRDLSHWLQP